MTASPHHTPPGEPPRERRIGRIGFRTTEDESLLIRKAAELQGWTVTQYVLCAVLDRAERDLYEHAARLDRMDQITHRTAEPLSSLACVYGR
jgi:uncharacterized protein (DUF1778 family)